MTNDPRERPKFGWAAWEATAGYIAIQYSPDVSLTLQVTPDFPGNRLSWAATIEWAGKRERVTDRAHIADALRDLWYEVNRHHVIFKTVDAALKRPEDYADTAWFDARTTESIDRLTTVISAVFESDWTIVIIYHPSQNPTSRFQMRLIVNGEPQIRRGGRGASLRDVSRGLYLSISDVIADAVRRRKRDETA